MSSHGWRRALTRPRQLRVLAVVAVVSMVAAATGLSATTPPRPKTNILMGGSSFVGKPRSQSSVKIGLVADLAGKLGAAGPDALMAAQLMVALANTSGGIMGRPVTLVTRDDGGDPVAAVRYTQELLASERVNFLLAGLPSNTLLAQAPFAKQFKVPTFAAIATATDFILGNASLYQGMLAPTSQQEGCGMAVFLGKKRPQFRRIALLTLTNAYGKDFGDNFKRCLAKYAPNASVVVQKDYDVATQDFRPVFSAVLSEKPDFIATTLFGGLIPRFTTQYLGGGNRTPFGVVLSELGATRALGTSVPENVMYATTRTRYTELAGTSARPWIKEYAKKFRQVPGDTAIQVMGAFLAYKAAVEKARSVDGTRVATAFRCIRYYEPRGWVTIRALNGQADVPSVVGQMRFPAGKEAHLLVKDRIFVYSHDTWDGDAALARVVPEDAQVARSACK